MSPDGRQRPECGGLESAVGFLAQPPPHLPPHHHPRRLRLRLIRCRLSSRPCAPHPSRHRRTLVRAAFSALIPGLRLDPQSRGAVEPTPASQLIAAFGRLLLCRVQDLLPDPPQPQTVCHAGGVTLRPLFFAHRRPKTQRAKEPRHPQLEAVKMSDPDASRPAEPSSLPLTSPRTPLHLSFPFLREGSQVWERERKPPQPRELPSPLPTKRTRTYSATVRAKSGPVYKGVCKNFSRSQGHGFIRPSHGGEDIFVHISDIEGEYVPMEGDEVTYKVCPVPPKNQKFQAVDVVITHLNPGTKHETWSGQIISS